MKLHPDSTGTQHIVTAITPRSVVVNGRVLARSLLLMPDHLDENWGPVSFAALETVHLAELTAHACDVLLLGTGRRQRFPSPMLLRPLIDSGRGFEIMDTAAACRTYNLLVGEGRIVLAALIVEGDTA